MTVSGHFATAAWLIVVAGLFDGFDGVIARHFHLSSEFGLQMDSLGDVISSGVSPAILIYEFYLKSISSGEALGLILSFMPLLFASFRLARFNVVTFREGRKSSFYGMPAPMSAAALSSIVIMSEFAQIPFFNRLLIIMVPIVSLLMASTLKYSGFPKFSLKERGNNRMKLTVMVVTIFCAFLFPEIALFLFMMIYTLSGVVKYIWERTAGIQV